MRRKERLYLREIKDAISQIRNLASDREKFFGSKTVQAATFWHLTVIGEAARQLSEETKAKEAQVEWAGIVAMRNVLVHAYFGIELQVVWRTIEADLPVLEKSVDRLLQAGD